MLILIDEPCFPYGDSTREPYVVYGVNWLYNLSDSSLDIVHTVHRGLDLLINRQPSRGIN